MKRYRQMRSIRLPILFGVLILPVCAGVTTYTRWPFDAKEAASRQAETAKALKSPVQLTLDLGNSVRLKLVLIPAGKFVMGSPEDETRGRSGATPPRTNEWPQHEVTIDRPFYMSIYKVTQEQFEQVMGMNPSKFTGKNNPVDAVSWDDAVRFCQKVSEKLGRTVHLPTEAQWEYASRAGSATPYFFGDDEKVLGDYMWYHDNAKGMTHPVGQKRANSWGLFDVHGLLWEYCSDFYTDSYANSQSVDPSGPVSGSTHVVRGGTYGSRAGFVRVAIRIAGPEANGTKDVMSHFGFRVAMDLPASGAAGNLLRAEAGQTTAQPSSEREPKIFSSFDAISGDPGMSYKDHPDMALAACSSCGAAGQVLAVTGQDIAVYDTAGKLLKSQHVEDFIKAAGIDFDAWRSKPALPARAAGKVDDPRATYDPFIGRWIVACTCSGDFLIVSGGKDATGRWKGAALSDAAGDLTAFPGWDKNGVYVSEFEPKLNSRVFAIPSADVAWKGSGNISLAHEAIFSQRLYEMRPAIDPNPNKKPTDPEYVVSRSGPPWAAENLAMDLMVDRISWQGTKASISGPASIPTGFLYNSPVDVPQPSAVPIRANESHRVFSVLAHSGDLYVVEASGPCAANCGAQGQDANDLFYWFDVDTKTMTLRQKAKVSDPKLSLLFPTMALDAQGNAGIAITGMSASEHPSVYLFTHLASDTMGKINGPFLAQTGTENYTCSKGPTPKSVGWGTYSATVRDGSDPMKLWTLQEYAGSSTSCVWKTRVIGFQVQPGAAEPRKPKHSHDSGRSAGW